MTSSQNMWEEEICPGRNCNNNLKFAWRFQSTVKEIYIPLDEKQQIWPEAFNVFFCQCEPKTTSCHPFQGAVKCLQCLGSVLLCALNWTATTE